MQFNFILDQPQMGENIGAAARVMANFSFHNLHLVNPRDGWPNEKAKAMATSGKFILEHAKLYECFDNAISQFDYVFALCGKEVYLNKPTYNSKDIMQIINNLSVNNVGFIFGCERIGLTQQQISKCNAILTIPVCAEHMSMNLAQAVAVIAYELNNNEVDYLVKQHQECAKVGEVNFFVAQLFEMLGKTRFIKHEKHQENLLITIRNIMLRANLSKNELQTMHGIIKSLYEK